MNALRIISLARRIVTQCVRDKRTLGLIIIVPSIVMALLGYFYTTNTSSMVTLGVADSDAGLGGLNLAGDVDGFARPAGKPDPRIHESRRHQSIDKG